MTLLLHTSTPAAYLGLVAEGRFLVREEFPLDPRFSEQLAEHIRRLLERVQPLRHPGLLPLETVVVHAGPGGFTSLRIGVTTANTLAYALGIPVIGVSGDISGLDELLVRSSRLPPTKGNLVVPAYGREPALGPSPS